MYDLICAGNKCINSAVSQSVITFTLFTWQIAYKKTPYQCYFCESVCFIFTDKESWEKIFQTTQGVLSNMKHQIFHNNFTCLHFICIMTVIFTHALWPTNLLKRINVYKDELHSNTTKMPCYQIPVHVGSHCW